MNQSLVDILLKDQRGHYIRCTKCNTESTVYNPQKIQVFICPECRMVYGSIVQLGRLGKNKDEDTELLIPLYRRCTFDKEYTVIGRALKHEKNDVAAIWEEYTLIDDEGTYSFLSVSYGHWILLHECELPAGFDLQKSDKAFVGNDGLEYTFYSSYYQKTIAADGEFPYDVVDAARRLSREYVSPPHIFTVEKWGGKSTFFQGRYVQPSRVSKAFDDKSLLIPAREGVGSCQPFYLGINYKTFNNLSLAFFLLTLPVYFLSWLMHPRTPLAHVAITLVDSSRSGDVVSPSFKVSGTRPSVVRVDCNSNVLDDWIEGQVVMVNEQTGVERSCVVGIEYYHGVADGESWSESSNSSPIYLDQVEPGTYHFELSVVTSENYRGKSFVLDATTYTATAWNYWLLVGSLLVINLVVAMSGNKFEKVRFGITDEDNGEDE